MSATQEFKKANDELGSWLFPTGISFAFLGALAGNHLVAHPDADLWDMTFGALWNFFLGDPTGNAVGVGANAAAGISNMFNGFSGIGAAAKADLAATGGTLILAFGLAMIGVKLWNKLLDGPSPA